jgi:Homeodomain-like domain
MARDGLAPEIKAQVMAALLSGQRVAEIAERFGLNERTVRRWREAELSVIVQLKREQVLELTLGYLVANMKCLTAQCEVFSDANYLKAQSASENAVLHGVISDKGLNIFRALEAAEQEGEEG